jgi:phosphate transport system substrate-binding protein
MTFRMRARGLGWLALLAALGGCGHGGGGPSSEVVVDGSSTVFRISRAAQEQFARKEPNILVVVDMHGTGGGFGRYLQGEVDIVDASRPAKDEETSKAEAQGIPWTRFIVGHDGVTLVVNKQNDFVKSLSVAQLRELWQENSKVKTWKDLDPSWPDRKIVLYSPDHDSGTFEFFVEQTLGKEKPQRSDVQVSADDNTLVNGVAGDADGLGYFGYAYYAANTDKLRAVPVQAGPDDKPVMPGPDTILDGSYRPLSRPLFVYVKNSALRRPEVMSFLKFYLDNVGKLATDAKYVPPTADEVAANAKAWPAHAAGPAAKVAE